MAEQRVLGLDVAQVALVVRDLDAALERWTALGYGPWRVYNYGDNLQRRRDRRGDGSFEMLLAVSGGSPQIELVQPVAGPSIYEDWLTERGEGLHHVGLVVEDDFDAAVQRLVDAGFPVIPGGRLRAEPRRPLQLPRHAGGAGRDRRAGARLHGLERAAAGGRLTKAQAG